MGTCPRNNFMHIKPYTDGATNGCIQEKNIFSNLKIKNELSFKPLIQLTSVFTVRSASTRTLKQDPILICFDKLFFRRQLPSYFTVLAMLVVNSYHSNSTQLPDNFYMFFLVTMIYMSRE